MEHTKSQRNSIHFTNKEAVRLAKLRAAKEKRSAANAAAVTIIEALKGKYDDNPEETENQSEKKGV